MQQLLPLKAKIWFIVSLAAVISAVGREAGLGTLSLGTLVGVVELVTIQLMLHSWPALQWLRWLPRPAWARVNLSGEWRGEIVSQCKKHPDDPPLPPIPTKLHLHQSWQEVVFSLETEKMHSRSSPAGPSFDPSTKELQFRYFFNTNPTGASSKDNPPQQLGSALARINLARPECMSITYTNERGPGGDITLEWVKGRRRSART